MTPLFLAWILIPALFLDDINIQDIIFPSLIKTDEFSEGCSVNDSLIPFANLSQNQNISNTSTAAQSIIKVFFDEDSPYLPISLGTVKFMARIEHSDVKELSSSHINYSAIYLMNGSLII